MILKIKSHRITKKGNIAFQTKFGEMFLNPASAKCRANFKKYFPHLDLKIKKGFDADTLIGECCIAYPVLEPINNPDRVKYELEQLKEVKEINRGCQKKDSKVSK